MLLEGADLQPDAGRLALQARQQTGQHGERHEVVGHDHEVAVAVAGSNAAGGARVCSTASSAARTGRTSDEGALCRDHAAAPPDQQRITEQRAQLPERIADGRLRQPEARAGAAHAALGEEGVQDRQQVQVDGADIHGMNSAHRQSSICPMVSAGAH